MRDIIEQAAPQANGGKRPVCGLPDAQRRIYTGHWCRSARLCNILVVTLVDKEAPRSISTSTPSTRWRSMVPHDTQPARRASTCATQPARRPASIKVTRFRMRFGAQRP